MCTVADYIDKKRDIRLDELVTKDSVSVALDKAHISSRCHKYVCYVMAQYGVPPLDILQIPHKYLELSSQTVAVW